MTWFQIWTVCWQIAIVVTPLVVTTCALWLNARFQTKTEAQAERNRVDAAIRTDAVAATQGREAARDKLAEHDSRIVALEEYKAQPPSQHKVFNAIAIVQAEVREVTKEVAGLARTIGQSVDNQNRQFDTLNSYLHTLVERGLR